MDSAGLAAKLAMFVYPTKGQTKDQQAADEQACYAWAREQTGIDPTTVTVNSDSAAKAAKAKTDSAAAGRKKKKAAEKQAEQQATTQAQGQRRRRSIRSRRQCPPAWKAKATR